MIFLFAGIRPVHDSNPVFVDELVQLVFCIQTKPVSAIFICRKQNAVDLVCRRVILIMVSAAVNIGEAVSAELCIRVAKLAVKICFREACQIVVIFTD